MHQSNDRPLRIALFANAAFSTLCACALVFATDGVVTTLFAADTVGFGIDARELAPVLGVALFVFAGLVAWTASTRLISRASVKAIIGADIVWVVSTIALLPLSGSVLTDAGFWLVSILALIVLLFAIEQTIGLILLYQGKSALTVSTRDRIHQFRLSHPVNAPAQTAWLVMTDHEAYADVADNLSKVEVLQGEAKGMRRKCYGTKGESWTEKAHIWEDGKRFGFIIDTDLPTYPYPLEHLAAVWSVEPDGANRSVVTMAFDVMPQASLKGAVFMFMSLVMFPGVVDRLLGRWAARMESRRGPGRSVHAERTAAR